jgi:hypothetical protein
MILKLLNDAILTVEITYHIMKQKDDHKCKLEEDMEEAIIVYTKVPM